MSNPQSVPPEWFDPVWYLKTNHDVRASGADPWQHYQRNGKAEGRAAAPCAATLLDQRLWRGFEVEAHAGLEQLVRCGNAVEQARAHWFLGRWHASYDRWENTLDALRGFHGLPQAGDYVPHAGPFLLGVQAALKGGDLSFAKALNTQLARRYGPSPDASLADMLLHRHQQATDTQIGACLETIYKPLGLSPVMLGQGQQDRFDRLSVTPGISDFAVEDTPLVTVIVPAFNAAQVLHTALESLAAQEWQHLEVLIVDDCSDDDSCAIAQGWADKDTRFRVIAQDRNQGAYVARNAGFAAARGVFTTVLDADDWAHPARIRLQAEALCQNANWVANTSHWVRVSPDLDMSLWRIEDTWVFRNISSLMVRTTLRDTIGFWDRVRVNADTEYYHRIMARFGADALGEVLAGVPLSFGRTLAGSLTTQSALHSRTQYHGVRRSYHDAAKQWHQTCLSDPDNLFMPEFPLNRAFNVSAGIGPSDPPAPLTEFDMILTSRFFDAQWYRETYDDVVRADINPALHYLQTGATEHRDPGPLFSTGAYVAAEDLAPPRNALLDWVQTGAANRDDPLEAMAGQLDHNPAQMPVMVFASSASTAMLGAERALLTVLYDLIARGARPVVVLPTHPAQNLLNRLLPLVQAVEILPHQSRHASRTLHKDARSRIEALLAGYAPDQIHVTDAACFGPLQVGSDRGIETVLYLDGLPADAFGMQGATLCAALRSEVDRFVVHAHDHAAIAWLGADVNLTKRQPAFDPRLFGMPPAPSRRLRIATIGTLENEDEIAQVLFLACYVANAGYAADFVLIGPMTSALRRMMPLGPLVQHLGLAPDPISALAQADVVLDLAPRAWGAKRSTYEAMAAGRPVVSHARAGVPVVSGQTGLTVPPGRPQSAARAISALCAAVQIREEYGRNGRMAARLYMQQ